MLSGCDFCQVDGSLKPVDKICLKGSGPVGKRWGRLHNLTSCQEGRKWTWRGLGLNPYFKPSTLLGAGREKGHICPPLYVFLSSLLMPSRGTICALGTPKRLCMPLSRVILPVRICPPGLALLGTSHLRSWTVQPTGIYWAPVRYSGCLR